MFIIQKPKQRKIQDTKFKSESECSSLTIEIPMVSSSVLLKCNPSLAEFSTYTTTITRKVNMVGLYMTEHEILPSVFVITIHTFPSLQCSIIYSQHLGFNKYQIYKMPWFRERNNTTRQTIPKIQNFITRTQNL